MIDELIIQIINGIMVGTVLCVITLGLSIIFGLLEIFNFAHGAFYMLGVYNYLFVLSVTGNYWLSMLIGAILAAIEGLVIYLALGRILVARAIDSLVATYGLNIILIQIVKAVFGPMRMDFPYPPELSFVVSVPFFTQPGIRIFDFFVAIAATFVLWVFLEKTNVGIFIRAAVQDLELAKIYGVRTSRLFIIGFTIGALMAGLGGILHAPMVTVSPFMGESIIILSFIVVVVGGVGDVRGTVIGSLVIGILVSVFTWLYYPAADFVAIIIMAIIMVWKPRGLFGRGTNLG